MFFFIHHLKKNPSPLGWTSCTQPRKKYNILQCVSDYFDLPVLIIFVHLLADLSNLQILQQQCSRQQKAHFNSHAA